MPHCQDTLNVCIADSKRPERYQHMVNEIGTFKSCGLSIPITTSKDKFSGLFPNLLQSRVSIRQETLCVTRVQIISTCCSRRNYAIQPRYEVSISVFKA